MSESVLTEQQAAIAARVLDEESRARFHLVVALSGAHAYGFPSPDSDLDLKAIHVDPTRYVLGLQPTRAGTARMEVVDGVEIDYSSNELQPVLLGVLSGNGNYLERILGRHLPRTSPELATLQPIVRRALSRRVFRHYQGFAGAQRREFETSAAANAKKALYVLRTALTGAHLLATGELETDLGRLHDRYGVPEARGLIEAKLRGERVTLPADARERWRGTLDRAFAELDRAHRASSLPEESPNRDELESWLIELRRRRMEPA